MKSDAAIDASVPPTRHGIERKKAVQIHVSAANTTRSVFVQQALRYDLTTVTVPKHYGHVRISFKFKCFGRLKFHSSFWQAAMPKPAGSKSFAHAARSNFAELKKTRINDTIFWTTIKDICARYRV